jgi:hypothetical protein
MLYSQPGVFNVLDDWGAGDGMKANDSSSSRAKKNAEALQATIDAAQAYCASSPPGGPMYGAIILIPSGDVVPVEGSPGSDGNGGTYFIQTAPNEPAVVVSCFYPIRFLGTGNGATLAMQEPATGDYQDLFRVENTQAPGFFPDANIGGLSFENLLITYPKGASGAAAAIHVLGGSQNVRLFRTVLYDCPIGVALDDSLQCSIIDCQIECDNDIVTAAVTLGTSSTSAIETYIAGCIFEAGGLGYQSGTGLLISQADHVRVVNTRIQAFGQAIAVQTPGNAKRIFFSNVAVYPTSNAVDLGAALLIQPSLGASVTQAVFVGCFFLTNLGTMGGTDYTGPGVLLDGSSGVIDQVRFVSCYACNWNGPGLQINGGSNIEIVGGYFSCNAGFESLPSDSPPPAGIAITAVNVDVSGVRITGAGCTNSFYQGTGLSGSPPLGAQQPATQLYGIYVQNAGTGIASNIVISACDLTGNLAYGVGIDAAETSEGAGIRDVFIRRCNLTGSGIGAVQVIGSPETQITDCAGYNDQAKILRTVAPVNGSAITNVGVGYYGPVAFYVSTAVGVTIAVDGEPTGLTSGGFTLSPGEFAVLAWTGLAPPAFLMVGK